MNLFKFFTQRIRQRQQVAGLDYTSRELGAWFQTPIGQRILADEQKAIDHAISCLFGFHLLQLSVLPAAKLYRASRICHCCRVSFDSQAISELTCRFEALPLADESVDVTLLHHALDFSENPHQLLSEVSRVTIANGHIVIVGFNPISLTGAIKPFAQLMSNNPLWKRHSLRQARINDWLKLLGFEAQETYFGHSQLPLFKQFKSPIASKLRLPFGHFYCIVARKMVASIRPIKPAWDNHLLKGVKIQPRPLTARGAARLSLIKSIKHKTPTSSSE